MVHYLGKLIVLEQYLFISINSSVIDIDKCKIRVGLLPENETNMLFNLTQCTSIATTAMFARSV